MESTVVSSNAKEEALWLTKYFFKVEHFLIAKFRSQQLFLRDFFIIKI